MKTKNRSSKQVLPLWLSLLVAAAPAADAPPGLALIPAGSFEMGDHHGFVDPKHGGDETPVHRVSVGAFFIGIHDVTTAQYVEFLNAARASKKIEVRDGGVFLTGGRDLLCETRAMSPFSRIGWDGTTFSVLDGKGLHPVVCIRWPGAAAYCNWRSAQEKRPACYDESTWDCDFNKSGYRLPTEAEWEYAARGGQQAPCRNFPWGDEADAARANWPESRNPFRAGPQPWTTPVGFFDGKLHRKADFGWPGPQETFQTADGANGYGLHDMAGNVWQFVNDWYGRDYYAYSPTNNPAGPDRGSPMPDGKPYRGMRGGNWFNGENGHSRVSNRNPSYWRGPQDPDHPYYHIGFRVALPVDAESRPVVRPTPAQTVARGGGPGGGGRREDDPATRPPRDGSAGGAGRGDRQASADAQRPARRETDEAKPPRSGALTLTSPAVQADGALPVEFTGDGDTSTLPLEWKGAPAGTKSFAVVMHHIDPQGAAKWYWILYDIPADTRSLPKNVKSVGTAGNNSVNGRAEYAPPRSKGPGQKTYILTVYALSGAPDPGVPPAEVSREVLLAAMKGKILDSAELQVNYTRQVAGGETENDRRPPPPGDDRPRRDAARGGGDRGGPGAGAVDERRPRGERGGEQGGNGGGAGASADRPPRQDGRAGGGADAPRGGGGGAVGGGSGGRREMAENKTPTSPNPGQTVGLFLNTDKACPGYTLFAPKHNTVTFLVNNDGQVVHSWKSEYEPGQVVHLLPNGHLLRSCMLRVQGGTGGGEGGRIEEYDWDGNLVWEFNHATRDYQLHHDLKPLPNGHILALMVERKSREQALAAGFSPDMMRDDYLVPDALVEIEPVGPKGGKIVWEWHVWDHLVQDSDRSKPNYGNPAEHPERIYVNCNDRPTAAFWNHMNSLDYNARLDQIVLSVRGCNEIWIIDHSTTTQEAAGHSGGRSGKGGDLLYRWGNPAAYKRGTLQDKQLVQQHDAQWIPDGYPGAGRMTIFNNGYDRGWSSVEEIELPVDADGRYVLGSGKPYGPAQPAWRYEAKNRTDFFSSEISGAHRLPNGNTLICGGIVGNLFEVTPAGETAWQYVNPMVRGGILAQGELPGKDMRGHLWNAVFKVHRYAPDYAGLKGRDLTPKGVIELPASQKGKTGLDNMTEQQRTDRGPGGGGRRSGGNDRPGGGERGDRGNR